MKRYSFNSDVNVRNILAALIIAAAPTSAHAFTPQWLECTGEVSITPTSGAATKEAVNDIYAYDSDSKLLFKYSATRKQLSPIGTEVVSDQELRWFGSIGGTYAMTWEGRFDLRKMTLRLTYKSSSERRAWQQSCKPTQAQPES